MIKKQDYIEKYDSIMNNNSSKRIEYSMSDLYVHDLTPVFGVKEIIANFFDANGTNFTMNYQNGALIIKDDNQGIDIKYMVIGNSGSRSNDEKIGKFGEGYKTGALSVIREGHRIMIDTVGYTIVFYLEHSDLLKANVMCAKYIPNNRKLGTEVYIECNKRTYENAKKMFLFLNDYDFINNNIIKEKSKIKSIYLNGLEHAKKTSVFAYNLKQTNDMSNRDRNYIPQELIERQLIDIYNNLFSSEEISEVMNGILEYEGKFSKTLESKILNRLRLTEGQKDMFLGAVGRENWYTTNIDLVDKEFKKSHNVEEVPEELLEFLNYINANIIMDANFDISNNENIISTIILPKNKVQDLDKIEIATATLLANNTVFSFESDNKSTSQINLENDESLIQIISDFKPNYGKSTPYTDNYMFKLILNNLVFMSCYKEMDIKIIYNNMGIVFQSHLIDDKYHVIVKKDNKHYNEKELLIVIKRSSDFLKEDYELKSDNYIYANNLKYKKINSIASYRVKVKSTYSYFESDVVNIMHHALSNDKEYLEKFMEYITYDVYESNLVSKSLPTKTKKLLNKIFQLKYPNSCISKRNFDTKSNYDDLVESRYGLKVLKLSSNVLTHWLVEQGIPSSETYFKEMQKEKIETISYTEEMEVAVRKFENIYGNTQVKIELAISLPQDKESTHKNGIIYISKEHSAIPEFITGLIIYEYQQMINQIKSPSHSLQSILTHDFIG